MLNADTIAEFRRVAKLNEDWLVHAVVGPEFLTKGELASLQSEGALTKSLDLVSVSYALGRQAAHLKNAEYKSLTHVDVGQSLSDLESASLFNLRLNAANEIRQMAGFVASAMQTKLQGYVSKSLQCAADGENLEKSFRSELDTLSRSTFKATFELLSNIYNLAVLDLVTVAKSHAQLNCMVQREGIYTEGLESHIMVERGGTFQEATARDLMQKSLSGMTLYYIPPGAEYLDGVIRVVDTEVFLQALNKSVAGVSSTAMSAVVPSAGPSGNRAAAAAAPDPAPSMPGLASPAQTPGPGRGNTNDPGAATQPGKASGKAPASGIEYIYMEPTDPRFAGALASGEGWEKTETGAGIRKPKGSGGHAAGEPEAATEEQNPFGTPEQIKAACSTWKANTNPTATEVMDKLRDGDIAHTQPLGTGTSVSHKVFIGDGPAGIFKPVERRGWDTHRGVFGTGQGSVPHDFRHGHEAAAHNMSAALGLSLVPATTTRALDGGKNGSIQEWQEGHVDVNRHLEQTVAHGPNTLTSLFSTIPKEKHKQLTKQVHSLVTLHYLINHNDGQYYNVTVNPDKAELGGIDNSDTFGTGMKGVMSLMHEDSHRAGKQVKIPEDLQQKMQKLSLGDIQRTSENHLKPWQVGQTYLRAQYLLHLQKEEGHLDYNKFLPTMDVFQGGKEAPAKYVDAEGNYRVSESWGRGKTDEERTAEFTRRQKNGTLPNQLFESFAKDWIDTHKADPSSPHHSTANKLAQAGVFMHGEAMHAQQSYRGRDKHHSYERTITGRKPPVRGRVGHLANLAYPDSQAHPDTTLHSDDEHDTAKTAPRGKAGQKPPVIKTEELSPEDIQQV